MHNNNNNKKRLKESDCDGGAGEKKERKTEEDGGWLPSGTTCRRENYQGRKCHNGLNGGVSYS